MIVKMSRNYLIIVFILFEMLLTFCSVSGKESFNPFSPQPSQESGLENAELALEKELNCESNEVPSDEKIIEKRRLYFNDEGGNFPATTDRYPEYNAYLERRRTNYSEPENEQQIMEVQQMNNNWDNEGNRLSLLGQAGSFRNADDTRSRQPFVGQPNPNQRDWERRGDSFGNSQSQWNDDYNFKSFENNAPNFRMGNNYPARTPAMFNNKEVNGYSDDRYRDLFNKKASITTLRDQEMEQVKSYNERQGSFQSGFMGPSNINYCSRNPAGFWGSYFNPPERGVIINFNADCQKSSQMPGNQLMHKLTFAPRTSLETFPERDLISSPRMNPMYYL